MLLLQHLNNLWICLTGGRLHLTRLSDSFWERDAPQIFPLQVIHSAKTCTQTNTSFCMGLCLWKWCHELTQLYMASQECDPLAGAFCAARDSPGYTTYHEQQSCPGCSGTKVMLGNVGELLPTPYCL